MIPTIDDIHAAASRISDIAVRTPLLRCDALDKAIGARVFVKAENLQRGGAFKIRGAANAIAAMAPEVRARGVLAYSSGNHAIAVATAARLFKCAATIIMPADAPRVKMDATRANGAEIVPYDRRHESREAIAAALVAERGATLIKPFDDPFIIAGQGTAGLEIAAEITPDIAIVPASGGGLASGIALALPETRIIAVEPEGHDDIVRSLASGQRERNPPGVRSICDGLMVEEMGDITYEIARRRFERAIAIADDAVLRAMAFAFRHLKIVLEPSGAIGFAAALEGNVGIDGKTAVIVATGGNVDAELFASALAAP